MNAPILRISRLVGLLFAILLVSATVIQFVQAPQLQARPDNRRTLLDNYSRERGQILVGASAIAQSTPSEGELAFLRTYPQGPLYSHVTGYYSYVYGAGGGLESSVDDLLSGSSDSLFYKRIADLLTGKKSTGASLELTLNPKAQQAASTALGTQRGAVVALDPRTGAILALVSHPEYDPNQLSSHDLNGTTRAWDALIKDPTRPLVNRTISGNLYPPGSVFKIVTAAAGLSSGAIDETTQMPAPAVMDLPQTNVGLPNHDRQPCGPGDQTTLEQALVISCNTAFGWLGIKVGADALRDQAARFGFGETLLIPMRATPSTVPASLNPPQTAQSAIGQFDVRVTPLQVAMVSAAIANKGVVMRPYLVEKAVGANLETLEQHSPEQLSRAVSPEIAATLTRMLVSVVDRGTGRAARITGVAVAGKTGTAQQGNGLPPHAWFTAFAPADNPQIAVAVVVEDGGNAGDEAAGGRLAGPIAKAVMEAVVKK
ncbi:MAG: penicillin-binding transpeptidase domain-containing protein [Candidatus Phosphoribacter sp.]|nr:penicillin-binding protein 2 [Actinomycetales bacterium]